MTKTIEAAWNLIEETDSEWGPLSESQALYSAGDNSRLYVQLRLENLVNSLPHGKQRYKAQRLLEELSE